MTTNHTCHGPRHSATRMSPNGGRGGGLWGGQHSPNGTKRLPIRRLEAEEQGLGKGGAPALRSPASPQSRAEPADHLLHRGNHFRYVPLPWVTQTCAGPLSLMFRAPCFPGKRARAFAKPHLFRVTRSLERLSPVLLGTLPAPSTNSQSAHVSDGETPTSFA